MKHIDAAALEKMERFYRGNLINSITGFKSANLLGTKSLNGVENVAIFSSVTHLGSDPAMFTFVQRPLGHGVGHTYDNLKATGSISLNHVNLELVKKAHQSSAKYDQEVSEFEVLHLEKEYRTGIVAPFVAASHIQVAASYEGEYYMKENRCILVLCKITDIFLPEGVQLHDGFVNLEKAGSMAINGLDAYASATIASRYSYAQKDKGLTTLDF